jgi:DNA polymerase-1
MKKRTAVIDGDMIVYRAGFSSERETKWNDDIWTLQSSENEMQEIVNELIDYILEQTKADDYLMAFSSDRNFRYNLFPDYKANRKTKRKPLGIKSITNWVLENHNGIQWNNVEADDVAGMLCAGNPDMVAVSGDKDFATIPCEWFNFLTATTSYTTEEEADYNHLVQTLSGDSVDGYTGAKGIGTIGAQKLLDKHGATWQTVVDAYESKDQTEEDALLNARLAFILRDQKKYNNKEGEITLWKPKS